MFEWLYLAVGVLRSVLRGQRDLVLENLLQRQQLVVALRSRPRPKLRHRDRLFWALIQRLCDWH